MRWLKRRWQEWGLKAGYTALLKRSDLCVYTLLFVLLILLVPLVAEPTFELSKLLWSLIVSATGNGANEPSFRALALILAGAGATVALAWAVEAARRSVAARQTSQQNGPETQREGLKRSIWIVVALLLMESVLGEILITAGGALPVTGGWRVALLAAAFVLFFLLLVLLAAATLYNVNELTGTRLTNRIKEAEDRPKTWPAEVVICALSVPSKRMIEADYYELRRYEKLAGDDIAERFGLFAEPMAAARGHPKNAEAFVESFNWRQIALAYAEQMRPPYEPETLPLLTLLCSRESREHLAEFKAFFTWLLKPLQRHHPEFEPLARLKTFDEEDGKDVDFEELDSITRVLREVYNEQCGERGAGKVIIDITGAQRPWALAALEATLDTKSRKHCTFSYVAQTSFLREERTSWVRYYDIVATDAEAEDPVAEQIGGR